MFVPGEGVSDEEEFASVRRIGRPESRQRARGVPQRPKVRRDRENARSRSERHLRDVLSAGAVIYAFVPGSRGGLIPLMLAALLSQVQLRARSMLQRMRAAMRRRFRRQPGRLAVRVWKHVLLNKVAALPSQLLRFML